MASNQHIWQIWAYNLHRWGLAEWVANLLEAAGPMNLIAAQVVYMAQPLANRAVPGGHLQALAELLEDTKTTHSFAAFLREGNPQ